MLFRSAGYDLKVAERTLIAPGEIKLVPTGVKVYMQSGEVLYLYDRSSNPRKKGLVLINSVGVIDGDYYGNPGNEGHIFAQMKNITDQEVVLEVGERVYGLGVEGCGLSLLEYTDAPVDVGREAVAEIIVGRDASLSDEGLMTDEHPRAEATPVELVRRAQAS